MAAVRGEEYVDLAQADPSIPPTMNGSLAGGRQLLDRAATSQPNAAARIARDNVRLLAPVPAPQKVFCVGLNYADHARETGKEAPPEPVIFNKFVTAVTRT